MKQTADDSLIIKLQSEVEILKERNNQLEDLLNHDPNTGLPVRRLCERDLAQVFEESSKNGKKVAFGILRLDRHYNRIKNTRDRMKVFLFMTALRLQEIIGTNLYQSDRLDEFLLIIHDLENEKQLQETADAIANAVSKPYDAPATDVAFGCHMGLALYPDHGESVHDIMMNAEIALGIYEKRREHSWIFSPTLGRLYQEKMDIESDLYRALQDGLEEFHIVYQPIVNGDKKVCSAEALLRWNNPNFGSIPPSKFISIAEESGRITILGQWVLFNSLRQYKLWKPQAHDDFAVSVNVSPVQLEHPDFLEHIKDTLDALELDGTSLRIEVTESAIMEDPEEVIIKLRKVRDLGIKVLVDDFGTGYSSLSYLRKLPIDTLKIAKPFVDSFMEDEKSMEIVRAIISMSKSFGFETLAEGVEHKKQFDGLIEEGCELFQGFLFSPPVDADDFSAYYLSI